MPVKAAFGHTKAAAQPVDLQRFDAFLGQDRVPGLHPVVPLPLGAAYGAFTLLTGPDGPVETNGRVTVEFVNESGRQRRSGFLTFWPHVLLHAHN
jgi:hypothetical protein